MHDASISCVVKHALVYFIYTTTNGLYQSTTANDGIKLQRNVCCLKFIEHQLATEFLLFSDITEWRQFLGRVGDVTEQHRSLVFIDSHFGAGATRIDY